MYASLPLSATHKIQHNILDTRVFERLRRRHFIPKNERARAVFAALEHTAAAVEPVHHDDIVAGIDALLDGIRDYRVSAKIKQIEALTGAILRQVERSPDKRKAVRQFMTYYLPTTLKLLEQYVQLQDVGLKGENIQSGMAQIEALLDKVIVAFQKQLDGLFAREVVDITADIRVMEQMMAQNGLTDRQDFHV